MNDVKAVIWEEVLMIYLKEFRGTRMNEINQIIWNLSRLTVSGLNQSLRHE
jgi:hypothetical protein